MRASDLGLTASTLTTGCYARGWDDIPVIDPKPLWDFNDPSGSEGRFRAAVQGRPSPESEAWATQVARALGLQERYDEAHAVLDGLAADDAEVRCRVALERGRLWRSSGDPEAARPFFETAAEVAPTDSLRIDAWHMVALVLPRPESTEVTGRALEAARASDEPAAQAWEASLLNNLGMEHADDGDFAAALPVFEDALAVRRTGSDAEAIRVARWMVAWTLRNLGRTDEALVIQSELKSELDAIGAVDTFVDEELALLTTS
jgi:tetratricopeptide (TPR) repeat protein